MGKISVSFATSLRSLRSSYGDVFVTQRTLRIRKDRKGITVFFE